MLLSSFRIQCGYIGYQANQGQYTIEDVFPAKVWLREAYIET